MSSGSLVQYVIIRKDLSQVLNWSSGAIIAQACHATTAVIHLFCNDPHTINYLKDLDNMHKIILETSDENSIKNLEQKLNEKSIKFKLWIEKPENIPTCLALKPYPKNEVKNYFENMKLFKQ